MRFGPSTLSQHQVAQFSASCFNVSKIYIIVAGEINSGLTHFFKIHIHKFSHSSYKENTYVVMCVIQQ